MATTTAQSPYPQGFAVNINGDLSGCEELVAAPGAGVSHYLEAVVISGSGAQNITIGAGETGGAVTSAIFGPIYQAATGANCVKRFGRPIKVGANTSITVDSSAANAATVFVEGYTA